MGAPNFASSFEESSNGLPRGIFPRKRGGGMFSRSFNSPFKPYAFESSQEPKQIEQASLLNSQYIGSPLFSKEQSEQEEPSSRETRGRK